MWDWHWWKKSDPRAVAERLEHKASPGDIIVIHDGHHKDPRKDRCHAGGAVRLLVPALRARGYTFVPLCSNGNGIGSRVQRFKGSKVQEFKSSKVQGSRPGPDGPQTLLISASTSSGATGLVRW